MIVTEFGFVGIAVTASGAESCGENWVRSVILLWGIPGRCGWQGCFRVAVIRGLVWVRG
jgi:hypothetical protein